MIYLVNVLSKTLRLDVCCPGCKCKFFSLIPLFLVLLCLEDNRTRVLRNAWWAAKEKEGRAKRGQEYDVAKGMSMISLNFLSKAENCLVRRRRVEEPDFFYVWTFRLFLVLIYSSKSRAAFNHFDFNNFVKRFSTFQKFA